MQEFSFSLISAIVQGLRKESGAIRSDQGVSEMVNMQLRQSGPEPYDDVTTIISESILSANGIVINYPFPQLFKGKRIMLLVDEDEIYEVDTDDFTLTRITTFDAYDVDSTKDITADGVWHFADFHDVWFLYNGTSVVFRTQWGDFGFLPNLTYVQEDVVIGTGDEYKGRLVMSGFDPANFWNDEWDFALECMKDNMPAGVEGDEAIKNNFVWWTMIANGDMLWLFYPELAFRRNSDNEFTLKGSRFLEAIQRNDMGFMPMPWNGDVHAVKTLGNYVIIYGAEGIAALRSMTEIPTLAMIPLTDYGIKSRAHIGGGDKGHVFVDTKGQIRRLNPDLTMQFLDYSEFILPILDDDFHVVYDENENEFYIGSGSKSFLLNDIGLTEIHQIVTSVLTNENGKVGLFESTGVATSTIVTNIIVIGNSALNTLTSIELDGEYESGIQVAVDYRYDRNSAFVRTDFIELNTMGWARFNYTGLEFRVVIRAPDFENFNPSDVTIKWKNIDKRNIRGINVSKIATR